MAVCDGKLEWIEQGRLPNTQYVLSCSYGKDSIAMIEACRQLHYPLDRIVTADVWATDTIHADLPPMVEFKAKADRIIKERYGLTVEHVAATKREREREREKLSYEKQFYTMRHNKRIGADCIYGFPMVRGAWCNARLKMQPLNAIRKADLREILLPNPKETKRPEVSWEAERIPISCSKTLVQLPTQGECTNTIGFFR